MRAPFRFFAHAALACLFALALPACDSGSDDDDDGGGGGGGSAVSLDGSAYAFDATTVDGGALFLYLFDETVAIGNTESYQGDVLFLGVEAAAVGTYSVGAAGAGTFGVYGEDIEFAVDTDEADPSTVFSATAGTVSISSVSADEVRGSYDLRLAGPGGVRNAEGSFTAAVLDEEPGAEGDGGGDDDDPEDDTDRGSFTAAVTGAYAETLTGFAQFEYSSIVETLALNFQAGTYDEPGLGSVVFQGDLAQSPTVGTYPLGSENGGFTARFVGGEVNAFVTINADSGTLTVSEVEEDRIAGTYSFTGTASPQSGDDLGEATVSGVFEAYDF